MRNLCKAVLTASVAIAAGFVFLPAAHADVFVSGSDGVVLDTTPVLDNSLMITQPVISQPAIIDNTITAPAVIDTTVPVVEPTYIAPRNHLFHLGVGDGLFNMNLF